MPDVTSSLRKFVRKGLWALPRQMFLQRVPYRNNCVCLTFDDGPHPEHTPRMLDTLASLQVRATFFLIGVNAQRHPQLVRRIANEGHSIGNHSYHHLDPSLTTSRQLLDETLRTRHLLSDLTGNDVRLFRPPHGRLTLAKLGRLWWSGQQIVMWSKDPKDFACGSTEELNHRLDAMPLSAGDVLLLHDRIPYASEVLPRIIDDLRKKGVTFATISQCM